MVQLSGLAAHWKPRFWAWQPMKSLASSHAFIRQIFSFWGLQHFMINRCLLTRPGFDYKSPVLYMDDPVFITTWYGFIINLYNFYQINLKRKEYIENKPEARLLMGFQAQNEAYHGLPSHWVKPFYKPYKMDLTFPNRHFNFDKFRVYIRFTCQTFDGPFQDYLGGVTYLKRQDNPGV